MKFILILAATLLAIPFKAEARILKEMKAVGFIPNAQTLRSDEIQYYYQLNPPVEILESFKTLDFDHVLSGISRNNYYIQTAKVAYRINKPISYFSSQRVCDETYLKELYVDLEINQTAPCKFRVASSFPAPGFSIDLKPTKTGSLQYTHDFTRIMGMKTVLTTSSSINYSEITANETLVTIYSLSFIYNLPPNILGGADAIKNKLLEQMSEIADRTETISD